jgi:hypothetical protein
MAELAAGMTPPPYTVADLGPVVDELYLRPHDPEALAFAATVLDAVGPTRVELEKPPNWLRLAWFRARKRLDDPHVRRNVCGRWGTKGWAVVMEVECWLGAVAGHQHPFVYLDHWGRTVVAGRLCLVNEPYHGPDVALAHLRPLAELLGCPLAYANRSAWLEGELQANHCRVLLFPPQGYTPPPRSPHRDHRPRPDAVR